MEIPSYGGELRDCVARRFTPCQAWAQATWLQTQLQSASAEADFSGPAPVQKGQGSLDFTYKSSSILSVAFHSTIETIATLGGSLKKGKGSENRSPPKVDQFPTGFHGWCLGVTGFPQKPSVDHFVAGAQGMSWNEPL